MRKAIQLKGIFCIEGVWDTNNLREGSSIQPLLELLKVNAKIPYLHAHCATCAELEFYLSKWTQRKYDRYPILYLVSHGEEYGIDLANEFYGLDDLGEIIGPGGRHRIVMISSCSTFAIDKRHLKCFIQATGCLAICGYKADVDYLKSASFELLLLQSMQDNEFSGRGICSIRTRIDAISKAFPDLGFRMVTSIV